MNTKGHIILETEISCVTPKQINRYHGMSWRYDSEQLSPISCPHNKTVITQVITAGLLLIEWEKLGRAVCAYLYVLFSNFYVLDDDRVIFFLIQSKRIQSN